MRRSSVISYLVAGLLLAVSCQLPSGVAKDEPKTGSISGNASFSQASVPGNGIIISAELVDASARTASIRSAVTGKSGVSRSLEDQTTADADGHYELGGLSPGMYTVYASSPNSLEKAVFTAVHVKAGRSVTAEDLHLTATGSISGRVTRAGEPTGNLGVVVYLAGTSYSAMTADDGSFKISAVPSGSSYLLVAVADGYLATPPESVSVVVASETRVIERTLVPVTQTPKGSVKGIVTLSGEAADANAGIFVYIAGTAHLALTDEMGNFAFEDVTAGSYTLRAERTGFDSQDLPISVDTNTMTVVPEVSLAGTLGIVYQIFYSRNGATSGYVPFDSNSYRSGESAIVLENTSLKIPNSGFTGWNTKADGTGATYLPGEQLKIARANAVLYAQYILGSPCYVLGTQSDNNSGYREAGYWENGVWMNLPPKDGLTINWTPDMLLHEGHLVVSGNLETVDFRPVPGYWIDRVWQDLPLEASNSGGQVRSMLVIGTELYFFGHQQREAADGNMIYLPGFWKNNEWTSLPLPERFIGSTGQVFVDGSDLYVAFQRNSGQGYGGYWKNGTFQALPLATGETTAYVGGFAVDGLGVLVTGTQYRWTENNSYGVAGLWRDGVWKELPIDGGMSNSGTWYPPFWFQSSLYVQGQRYDSSWGKSFAGYWKDFAWVTLPREAKTTNADVSSFWTNGHELFALGSQSEKVDGVSRQRAGYWAGTKWSEFLVPDQQASSGASSIVFDGPATLAIGSLYWNTSNPQRSVAGYWKDGSWIELPSTPSATQSSPIKMILK